MSKPTAAEIAESLWGASRRKSKYGVDQSAKGKAARTEDNIVFQSKRECDRYRELRGNLRAGVIRDLKLQVRFPLVIEKTKICDYVADFTYFDLTNRFVIEDSKGAITKEYRLKFKLFHVLYPDLRIVEV